MANMAAVRPLSHPAFQRAASSCPDLTQGIVAVPRGAISEILGVASSGRTAVAHWMLSDATLGAEVCAWIDLNDAFDPVSAKGSGADLGKLLWVQCRHSLNNALRAADMILHSGGFGLVVLDLCNAPDADLRRVPTSFWYRLRNALEPTKSALLVLAESSIAKSCAARQFSLECVDIVRKGWPPYETLERIETRATSRKPMNDGAAKMDLIAAVAEVV